LAALPHAAFRVLGSAEYSADWSSQDLVDTPSPGPMRRFELLRTQAAEVTVTSALIVTGVDVIGHVGRRQFSILVDLILDSLLFQTAEEGLGDRVVSAVGFTAHVRLQLIGVAEPPPRVAAVLRPLIGVNHRAARRRRRRRMAIRTALSTSSR